MLPLETAPQIFQRAQFSPPFVALVVYTISMVNLGRDVMLSIEALLDDPAVYALLEACFKDDLSTLIARYHSDDDDAADTLRGFLFDSFNDDSVPICTLYGLGGYGVFPITIYQYGSSIFYSNAPEFELDDIFDTFEEAYSHARYNRFYNFIEPFWAQNKPLLLTAIKHLPETLHQLKIWIATPSKSRFMVGNVFSFEKLLYLLPEESIAILYHADASACDEIVNAVISSTKKHLPPTRTTARRKPTQRQQNIIDLIAWSKQVKNIYASLQQRNDSQSSL